MYSAKYEVDIYINDNVVCISTTCSFCSCSIIDSNIYIITNVYNILLYTSHNDVMLCFPLPKGQEGYQMLL